MFVFVYSSHHPKLSFPHLVVIGYRRLLLVIGCTLFTELCSQDMQVLPLLPKFPTQSNPRIKNFKPKKILQSSPSLEIQWNQDIRELK